MSDSGTSSTWWWKLFLNLLYSPISSGFIDKRFLEKWETLLSNHCPWLVNVQLSPRIPLTTYSAEGKQCSLYPQHTKGKINRVHREGFQCTSWGVSSLPVQCHLSPIVNSYEQGTLQARRSKEAVLTCKCQEFMLIGWSESLPCSSLCTYIIYQHLLSGIDFCRANNTHSGW